MQMHTSTNTGTIRVGQASADGRGGGGGSYSPGPRQERERQRRQEYAGKFPHWCAILGLMELSEKVAGLWSSTVGSEAVEEPAAPAPAEAPRRRPPAQTPLLVGFYHATASAIAAAPSTRAHPMDVLSFRRF